jgi:hypothetical protein
MAHLTTRTAYKNTETISSIGEYFSLLSLPKDVDPFSSFRTIDSL